MKELKLFGMRMKEMRAIRNLSQERLAERGGRGTTEAGRESSDGIGEMKMYSCNMV